MTYNNQRNEYRKHQIPHSTVLSLRKSRPEGLFNVLFVSLKIGKKENEVINVFGEKINLFLFFCRVNHIFIKFSVMYWTETLLSKKTITLVFYEPVSYFNYGFVSSIRKMFCISISAADKMPITFWSRWIKVPSERQKTQWLLYTGYHNPLPLKLYS